MKNPLRNKEKRTSRSATGVISLEGLFLKPLCIRAVMG